MTIAVTICVAIIGWIVVFAINNHFYARTRKRNIISSIIERLEDIQKISLTFWIDTNHTSTYADQQLLVAHFKSMRMPLGDLNPENLNQLLKLLHSAKKHITSTPLEITDFSKMDKSSKIFLDKYESGNILIQRLIDMLRTLDH